MDKNNIMQKNAIIFYTDCFVFGGCEKSLFEVMRAKAFLAEYSPMLVYRDSAEYRDGMVKAYPNVSEINAIPFKLLDIASLEMSIDRVVRNKKNNFWIKKAIALSFKVLLPIIFFCGILRLFVIFKRIKSKIVHINNGGYPGALGCRLAAIAAKLAGKYVIFTVNNNAMAQNRFEDKILDYLVGKSVATFITGSKASGRILVKQRGFDLGKIINIYHGIEFKENINGKRIDGKYVCMVARFEARKGHEYVILAWEKMLLQYPEFRDIKLVLIGDGPIMSMVKELVLQHGLVDAIEFLGSRSDYMRYVNTCMLLLNPSLYNEDLPYIIIEAMAVGIPVIGTNIAGIPEEVEDDVNGFIVPPQDIDALVNAIKTLLSDEQKRLAMGREARRIFFEKFTKGKMIDNYMALYNKIQLAEVL